jgi:hypothetical protein
VIMSGERGSLRGQPGQVPSESSPTHQFHNG